MFLEFDGLWWLLLVLGPLLFFQRRLHVEIQSVFLLLTRREDLSIMMFSLLFLPGVLLHEGSHYLTARILGVQTGGFSLVPRPVEGGRLQLGYVETTRVDVMRDALIGIAPLLVGGAFVAYAGMVQMGLPVLWESFQSEEVQDWIDGLRTIISQPDFWIWFYLTFAISSTMLPSRSDRRAWLPVTLSVAILFAVALLAGGGTWLMENVADPLNVVLRAIAIVFTISLFIQFVLVLPAYLIRRLVSHLTGLRVVSA